MSGLQPSQYAGHSYRIGAATTSASVGLPPPGLSKHWGNGPPTAMKDIFSAPILFFLGFPVNCWVTHLTKQTIFGWGSFVDGKYTLCICVDEVPPYRSLFAP